ncbi:MULTISPECIES: 3'-5' exonuclease [Pseudoalteromonas]|uniref:DNA polymerase III subunit epsilon n=1 Tax=Pseudoalteromonas amylolytica TaxID=1859457 RepID=A0A1S1MQG8_9GAMM|nr:MULTISPECIES: 3'-5' exonuclease [Pseudoalteromonas]OHU86961.1 DNA polymerase III subunit epsilon [Pseudoalteromonas sp. JW3]OHU88330.1 DNA polymerase III subunit epsilon [Pseudoalteromonas amylolytica]
MQGKIISWQSRFQRLADISKDTRLINFYQQGVPDPFGALEDCEFAALDFETTGLDPSKDDIVSVGIVPFDLKRIRCAQAKHWLVKPRSALAEESIILHRITHSQIEQAPDLADVLEEILATIKGRIIVVHYQFIEKTFFHTALMTRLGEGIEFPVIDTMEIEKMAINKHRSWLDRLTAKPIPSLRLADCRKRYGLPFYQAHHALSDALATAELLQAQSQYCLSPTKMIKDVWC